MHAEELASVCLTTLATIAYELQRDDAPRCSQGRQGPEFDTDYGEVEWEEDCYYENLSTSSCTDWIVDAHDFQETPSWHFLTHGGRRTTPTCQLKL